MQRTVGRNNAFVDYCWGSAYPSIQSFRVNTKIRKEDLIVEVLWKCPEIWWIISNTDGYAIVNCFAMNIDKNKMS